METINENELLETIGGGISVGLITGLVCGITFLVSMVYGYIHPNKC